MKTRNDGTPCGCLIPCTENMYKTQISTMAYPSNFGAAFLNDMFPDVDKDYIR